MTIPVSSIVNVSIATSPTFPSRKGFGILNCVTAETGVIGLSERIRSYSDIDGVAGDWGSESGGYKAALAYFSQNPRPSEFKASVRSDSETAAQLRGGSVFIDPGFEFITDGEFDIAIDGDNQTISALDFTGSAGDLFVIASTIQDALQDVGSVVSLIRFVFMMVSGF